MPNESKSLYGSTVAILFHNTIEQSVCLCVSQFADAAC